MKNIIKKSVKGEYLRLKGDKQAITAVIFLAVSIFVLAGGEYYHYISFFLKDYGFKKTVSLMIQVWLLYAVPDFAFLIFLEDGYKTKHHKAFFAVSMSIAVIFRATVIFINGEPFVYGFTNGLLPFLFSLELMLPALLNITALVCVLLRKYENAIKGVSAVTAAVSAANVILHLSYCLVDYRTVMLYISALFGSCAYFAVASKTVNFGFTAENMVSEQKNEAIIND